MFTHIPSGTRFENRKQAKRAMGTGNYNRAVKNREFTLHCTDEDYYKNGLKDITNP